MSSAICTPPMKPSPIHGIRSAASAGSGGDAFPFYFRKLGLGPLIGTRTWGGEIWLTGSNVLVDNGIATAA